MKRKLIVFALCVLSLTASAQTFSALELIKNANSSGWSSGAVVGWCSAMTGKTIYEACDTAQKASKGDMSAFDLIVDKLNSSEFVVASLRSEVVTNWVTVSKTIPEALSMKPGEMAPVVISLNQCGKIITNIVAIIKWKDEDVRCVLESLPMKDQPTMTRTIPEPKETPDWRYFIGW